MNVRLVLLAPAALWLLAACSDPASDATPPSTPESAQSAPAAPATEPTPAAAHPAASAGTPAGPATPGAAMGRGEVTAVDAAARTITIEHGPIEALKWPAMTMPFEASAEQIASVKAGDSIHFEFEQIEGRSRLTAVSAAQ